MAPSAQRAAHVRLKYLVLVLTAIASFASLTLPLTLRSTSLPLKLGDVAPRDLQAPFADEYVSAVLTEKARAEAEAAVAPVYAPADPAIARQQIEHLNTALQFIDLTRQDPFSSPEQKISDLQQMADLSLEREAAEALLALSEARWLVTRNEALLVLERVMRNTIRPGNLEDYRRSLPSLVSLSLSEDEAALVTTLVAPFVVPNSLFSATLTEQARQSARDAVQPVVRSFKAGETIVTGGSVINAADLEALERFGLIRPGPRPSDYAAAAAVSAVVFLIIGLFFFRSRPPVLRDLRGLLVLALTFLVFLAGARLSIPERVVVPYLYPLPAFALMIAGLYGLQTAVVLSLGLSLLAGYGLVNTLDLTPYFLLASLSGMLVLGPGRRVIAYARAALAIAAAGAAVLFAYRLAARPLDWLGMATLMGAAGFNGIASASLALLLQFLLAQSLGLTTPIQLLEISRPDHPLLQYFLRKAPGSYQHSLQVANLAEQAAEQIGADALLTRVGALFHDVGKAENASFFIENQPPDNIDTHDEMDPADAAALIIRHVTDGLELARKHRLPPRLRDFIAEHHGTLLASYQYNRALAAAGGDASAVDPARFRYPGPPPRSRETALLMLADRAEARARAERPADEEGLRALVRAVIESVQKERQLDNAPLTLRDLNAITESFTTTLRGNYHPRIRYPTGAPDSAAQGPTQPGAARRRG